MNATKRIKYFEKDKEEAEQEITRITAPLRNPKQKVHLDSERRIVPTFVVWRPDCPHCGKRLVLEYGENGRYHLTVALEE